MGWFCAALIAIQGTLLCGMTTAATPDESPEVDVRVLFKFSAPSARPWSFQLRLSDSGGRATNISEISNLSEAATTSGSFEIDRDGETLTVRSRHPIQKGQFQVRLRGSRDAKLKVESEQRGGGDGSGFSATELELVQLLSTDTIGPNGVVDAAAEAPSRPTWSATRSSSDWVRIEDLQEVPVYEPGATLNASIRVNHMIDHASQHLALQYDLYRVGHDDVIQTKSWPLQIDAFGNSSSLFVSEKLPEGPGVYEMRIQVQFDDENIWQRLRRRPPPLVRAAHPIAILHSDNREDAESVAWEETGVIRPSESSWSVGQWLPKTGTRLLPGASSISPAVPQLKTSQHAGKPVSVLDTSESFQATLPVATPGYPHEVTVRVPASSPSRFLIQVGSSEDQLASSFVFESEPEADSRDSWCEHKFVHYPVAGDQIWLTNLDVNHTAAFESISVRAGPLYLEPNSESPPATRSALLRLSSIDWTDAFTTDIAERTDLADCDSSTIALNELWVAADRISDLARSQGFTGIVVPANTGSRAIYQSGYFHPRIDAEAPRRKHLQALLMLLQRSRLRIHVELNPEMLLTDLEKAIDGNQVQLQELTRSTTTKGVDPDVKSWTRRQMESVSEGSTVAGSTSAEATLPRIQYSPLNPMVHQSIAALVKELNDLLQSHKNFAGIIVDCDGRSHLHPPNEAAVEVGEILQFGRAAKLQTGPSQLRTWVMAEGRKPFRLWRQEQLERGYALISRSARPDSIHLRMPDVVAGAFDDGESEQNAGERSTTSAVSDLSGISKMASYRYGPTEVLSCRPLIQQRLASASAQHQAVFFGQFQDQGGSIVYRSDLLQDLSRMIQRVDPELLVIDLALVSKSLDKDLAATLQAFRVIPGQPMRESAPIDSASRTVQLRWGNIDGDLYVSMIGVAPWTSDVDLEMSVPTTWELIGQSESDGQSSLLKSSGGTRTRVTIPPGRLIVARSKQSPGTSLRSWTTRVSGGPEAIESIKQRVTLIVERIGTLNNFKTYDRLTNGGFEQTGQMGLIGWMHAQHPPGCVQIDNKEFLEGKQSVLLTTDAPSTSRTWIVTETIEPPKSGRLAISLACRAEAGASDTTHKLRVSIEATRDGDPIRFSRDLEVLRDGQWSASEVVLEADEINDTDAGSLRLTIDSLSSGKVWLDDVKLHDRFPTAEERAELQSQAFLAVQGLQRGNLAASARLLHNHWANYLLELVPAPQSKRLNESAPKATGEPGVAERIRSWLPVPLRF